jgi:hypothetical protein
MYVRVTKGIMLMYVSVSKGIMLMYVSVSKGIMLMYVRVSKADPGGRAVEGVSLRPIYCWDRGFESC